MTTSQSSQQIPRIPGTIERRRLTAKLNDAVDYKLTLISAPPGFGKTTLAAQFAAQVNHPVVWHAIEERERDLPNLFAQSVQAFSQVMPGITSLTPPTAAPPNELAALLANYLRANLNTHIFYVLDDVQNLAGSFGAETWLRELIMHLPSRCHLIVLSRHLPDLPLTELIARREVLALGQHELQFTPDEVEQLARHTNSSVNDDEAHALAARLDGWPAGIALALQPLPPDLERVMLGGGQGPEALFDSLAHLMLKAQTARLQTFLLVSSVLTWLTPDLCATVLQLPDALQLLDEVQTRNLFVMRTGGGIAYHALFRSFLQRQFSAHDPQMFARLHLRAGEWFEQHDYPNEAFDHYMSAGQIQRAAALAEKLAQAFFSQGKSETLTRWGAQLAASSIYTPRLCYACAMIFTDRYEYADAEKALYHAEQALLSEQNPEGLTNVRLQQAGLVLQKGRYAESVSIAQQIAEEVNVTPLLRARALNIMGLGKMWLGQTEAAVSDLERAIPLYRADGDAYALSHVLQNLEMAYTRVGRLEDAGACLQEVVALRRTLSSAGALALALNNLGYHYHLRGNYTDALSTFREGLSIAAQVLDRRAEGHLLWSLGDLQRDVGDFDEAFRLYNRALNMIADGEPSLRSSLLISLSILKRWQHQFDDAVAYAEESLALATAHDLGLERAFAQAMMWAAYGESEPSHLALESLEDVANQLRRQGSLLELIRVLAVQAHIALLYANEAAADPYLRQAVRTVAQVSSVQPLVTEIIRAPALGARAGGRSNEPIAHGLRMLTDARARRARTTSTNRRQTPFRNTYSLNVYTLGQELLLRDGDPVPASKWRATAARELFLYLLFVGPQTREAFSLLFWPDSSTRHVRQNFHTTMYRARQALGENVIVYHDGVYRINPEVDLRCDALQLRELTAQARVLPPRDARTEDLWRRAVGLYQGEFLPSQDAEWIGPLRESMTELYLEALSGLGECARVRGDYAQAVETFKQALQIDPYREDIHRSIMTCYAQRGEKRKVAVHLAQLQALLWDELALKPSRETMLHARNLLS